MTSIPLWVRMLGYFGCIISAAILIVIGNYIGGMWALIAFINQWTGYQYLDLLEEKTKNSNKEGPDNSI